MKNKIGFIVGGICFCVLLAIAGIWKYQQVMQRNQKGILLAFDDWSEDTWRKAFDLFDEYGVKVTFFINGDEPEEFCAEAQARGHEIGYHTKGHAKLTSVTEEEFYEQAIEPIENFRKKGYKLTSFSYPYGAYEDWMNVELLKYYDTVRGGFYYRGAYKEDLKKGFIESKSIDNLHYESDENFREDIIEMLDGLLACDDGTVASMYSHAIGAGDWCITPERLEILFQEAQKRDLKFYTFHELQ